MIWYRLAVDVDYHGAPKATAHIEAFNGPTRTGMLVIDTPPRMSASEVFSYLAGILRETYGTQLSLF